MLMQARICMGRSFSGLNTCGVPFEGTRGMVCVCAGAWGQSCFAAATCGRAHVHVHEGCMWGRGQRTWTRSSGCFCSMTAFASSPGSAVVPAVVFDQPLQQRCWQQGRGPQWCQHKRYIAASTAQCGCYRLPAVASSRDGGAGGSRRAALAPALRRRRASARVYMRGGTAWAARRRWWRCVRRAVRRSPVRPTTSGNCRGAGAESSMCLEGFALQRRALVTRRPGAHWCGGGWARVDQPLRQWAEVSLSRRLQLSEPAGSYQRRGGRVKVSDLVSARLCHLLAGRFAAGRLPRELCIVYVQPDRAAKSHLAPWARGSGVTASGRSPSRQPPSSARLP